MAERTLKLADDSKLGGAAGTSRGRATAQRDLSKLQESVDRELVKFNEDKCNIMHEEGLIRCNDTGWGEALLRRTWGPWQTASSTRGSNKG